MQFIKLGNIVKIKTGKLDANAKVEGGKYPFFTCAREISWIDKPAYDCECVLVAGNGDLNVKYYHGKFDAYQRTYIIESNNTSELSMKYLYYFMQSYLEKLRGQTIGGVIQYIKMNNLTDIQIPFPSFEEQKSIVAKLDKLIDLIDLKKEAIGKTEELTKSVFFEMFGNIGENSKGFPVKIFSDICSIESKLVDPKLDQFSNYICIGGANIMSENGELINLRTAKEEGSISNKFLVDSRDILFSKIRPKLKKVSYPQMSCLCSADIYPIRPKDGVIEHSFLIQYLLSDLFTAIVSEIAEKRAQIPKVNRDELLNISIPLPPFGLQLKFSEILFQINTNYEFQKEALIKLENLYDLTVQEVFSF